MYLALLDNKDGMCILCHVAEEIIIDESIKFHADNEDAVKNFCYKWNVVIELLKNTKRRPYEEDILRRYLKSLEQGSMIEVDEQRLNDCIQFIVDKNFNISGWQLDDIPIYYAHCFWSAEKKQAFQLSVFEIGEVCPQYIDKDINEQDAESIDEAIEKYNVSLYINAGR